MILSRFVSAQARRADQLSPEGTARYSPGGCGYFRLRSKTFVKHVLPNQLFDHFFHHKGGMDKIE